ncbi:MAG: response regulator transcription factor [Labilithrix sp.]|nr:response regulator transcription factor [Labilithrix sp.]MCW5811591.1 response regulator transcription factor [Labilithrix sp.]
MIRVCIVDDQTIVRQGLRSLLGIVPDFEVVAEAGDGEEALQVIASCRPDIVLLDIRMPKLDGIGVLDVLAKRPDPPACLILTTFDDDELVLRGIARGARGYLLKDVSLEQLTAAIRTLADGGSVIAPAVTDRVLRGIERFGAGFESLSPPESLTKREIEILRTMASGFSNREIAKACFVAEGTVKNHISNILTKLGVRDRTRAVLRALHLGLI